MKKMRIKVRIIKEENGMQIGQEKNLKPYVAYKAVKDGIAEFVDKQPAKPKKTFVDEVEVEVKATEIGAEFLDFNDLKVAELKKLLDDKGIEIPEKAKKAELIELLTK